jgi:hypothetical protein
MVGLGEEIPSSMIPEQKSWLQYSSATHFFTHILPSLASVGPAGMIALVREQPAPTVVTRTQEG